MKRNGKIKSKNRIHHLWLLSDHRTQKIWSNGKHFGLENVWEVVGQIIRWRSLEFWGNFECWIYIMPNIVYPGHWMIDLQINALETWLMRLLLLSIPNHCFDVTVEADADVGKVCLQYPSNMFELALNVDPLCKEIIQATWCEHMVTNWCPLNWRPQSSHLSTKNCAHMWAEE